MKLSGNARAQLRWIVDRMHVGQSDAEVRADIRRRCDGAAWTEADIRAAEAYAVRVHHQNRRMYLMVTGGF